MTRRPGGGEGVLERPRTGNGNVEEEQLDGRNIWNAWVSVSKGANVREREGEAGASAAGSSRVGMLLAVVRDAAGGTTVIVLVIVDVVVVAGSERGRGGVTNEEKLVVPGCEEQTA